MGEKKRQGFQQRTPRTQDPMGIGCALAFALPFVGGGVLVMLRAAEVITEGEVHAPMWVLWLIGGLFTVAGLWIALTGVHAALRARWRKQRLREHRHDPWLADHPWNPKGIHDSSVRTLGHNLVGIGMMAVLLAVANWVAWFADGGDAPVFVKFIVGLFDVFLFFALWSLTVRIVRQFKYGRSWLVFNRFPFHPGESLDVSMQPPSNLRAFNSVEITLECVQERVVTERRGNKRRKRTVFESAASESVIIEGPGQFRPGGAGLRIPIAIPAGAPGTELSAVPARYWELRIAADTPGVDYDAEFLVPIYEKQGGTA